MAKKLESRSTDELLELQRKLNAEIEKRQGKGINKRKVRVAKKDDCRGCDKCDPPAPYPGGRCGYANRCGH